MFIAQRSLGSNSERSSPAMKNRIQPGSFDFVITDPAYITRYADHSGRTVANE